MIVQHGDRPDYYAACLACGWCSKPQASELAAGDIDDRHLACKLAARRPVRPRYTGVGCVDVAAIPFRTGR